MRKLDPRQRPSVLHTELTANVETIWLNNSGNGSEDDDFYWHMLLIVPSWPSESNQLFARARHSLQLEQGALYDLKGEGFLNPRIGGQRSYVLITSATKSSGDRAYWRPTFSILAQVKMTAYNRLLLYWTTSDDYEQATYGQTAMVSYYSPVNYLLNKKCVFKGEMLSGDYENHWFCGAIETFWL